MAKTTKDPFADTVESKVAEVLDDVAEEVNTASESEYIQATVSRVTPHIPANVRKVIYTAGIVFGVIGTIAPVVAAVLTGDAQNLVTSAGSLALALTNLLARLNLSKTATDIAKETA